MLGMPVVRQDEASPAVPSDDAITGCIWITGAWEVTVLMECSAKLARQATARMFDKEVHDVEAEDIRDAVGELTNMIGGAFKSLMPGSCSLTMPLLLDGNDYCLTLPSQGVVCGVAFVCKKQPLRVRGRIPKEDTPSE